MYVGTVAYKTCMGKENAMANNDRIYLAYSGQLGKEFELETKKRINWILEQSQYSSKVLDIGCSQGIVSLLLGEQGKTVTGIDIQPEAIEYAQNLMNEKYNHVKSNVEFKCIDFMQFKSDSKYDCIIITEVLEHLDEAGSFLEKAKTLLKENGKMILSVPFGVIDHPDHKSVFYLTNFYELVNKYFNVYSMVFIERWMGMIAGCEKREETKSEISRKDVILEEQNFEVLDKKMGNRIRELYNNWMNANSKYKEASENYISLKNMYNKILKEHNEDAEKYDKLLEEYNKLLEKHTYIIDENEKNFKERNDAIEKYEVRLKEYYKDIATTIEIINEFERRLQRLNGQNQNLAAANQQYQLRLEKIENNKIWKLEIKVYRKLKALKAKLRKG